MLCLTAPASTPLVFFLTKGSERCWQQHNSPDSCVLHLRVPVWALLQAVQPTSVAGWQQQCKPWGRTPLWCRPITPWQPSRCARWLQRQHHPWLQPSAPPRRLAATFRGLRWGGNIGCFKLPC